LNPFGARKATLAIRAANTPAPIFGSTTLSWDTGFRGGKLKFDWEKTEDVFSKLDEEVGELREAIQHGAKEKLEEEIGDLIFVAVNLARRLEVEPETALKKTNMKFRKRFKFIEDALKTTGKSFEECSIEELDSLWNEAKGTKK